VIKELCCGFIFALIATSLILSFIFFLGVTMDKTSCSSYGEVTNTKTHYDIFSGCYIKKGYDWYLLDSFRVEEPK